MTGTYPSFMATRDGRSILDAAPPIGRSYDVPPMATGYGGGGAPVMGNTYGPGATPVMRASSGVAAGGGPANTAGTGSILPAAAPPPGIPGLAISGRSPLDRPGIGGPATYGGRFTTGTGDRAMGNPSAIPGGLNAANLGQILRTLGITQGGGGGVGGAGGGAPGGIGPGETGAESGQRFAAANAAVNPSIRSALELASMGMSPLTGLPTQLAMAAFPGLSNVFGSLGLPSGAGFNVPGPQLTPDQIAQVSAAYNRLGPAYAQSMLQGFRQQRQMASATGGVIPGSAAALGAAAPAAMGSSGYGGIGPGGVGGGDTGQRGNTNPGGLGGGIGGGGFGGGAMGAGASNRSM